MRPALRRRSVTVRKTPDAGVVSVRAGDKVLGTVQRLAGEASAIMTGGFTHLPAFADVAPLFARLERAMAAGDPEDAIRAEIEAAGVHVWHAAHEMRLDQARSISIGAGEVRFRATDAFVMLRTGGL